MHRSEAGNRLISRIRRQREHPLHDAQVCNLLNLVRQLALLLAQEDADA